MKLALLLAALCVCAGVPLIASAQPSGPSPQQRAAFAKAHAGAKAAAYAALTQPHAAAVAAIAAKVAAGAVDPRAGAAQIDALLSPGEQKAVLAAADASHRAMRAAMGGPPPGGPPPGGMGGPPPGGGPPGGPPPAGPRFHPSAGGFLVMVSLTPEQMRALMPPRARGGSAP